MEQLFLHKLRKNYNFNIKQFSTDFELKILMVQHRQKMPVCRSYSFMKPSLGNKYSYVAQQFAVFHAWVASGSTSVRFLDLFTREVLTTWCKKYPRSLLRFLSLRIRYLVSKKEGDEEVVRRFFKKGYPGRETNLGSYNICLFSLSIAAP